MPNKTPLYLFVAIGEGGESENFGQDSSAAVDYLFESMISSQGIVWFDCPYHVQSYAKKHKLHYLPSVGFTSSLGTHVAIYWGDEDENVVHPLTKAEQKYVVKELSKLERSVRK